MSAQTATEAIADPDGWGSDTESTGRFWGRRRSRADCERASEMGEIGVAVRGRDGEGDNGGAEIWVWKDDDTGELWRIGLGMCFLAFGIWHHLPSLQGDSTIGNLFTNRRIGTI